MDWKEKKEKMAVGVRNDMFGTRLYPIAGGITNFFLFQHNDNIHKYISLSKHVRVRVKIFLNFTLVTQRQAKLPQLFTLGFV